MDLTRSMQLFVAVAREGSLAAAGRKVGVSAPSATRLLNDLENWIGQALVRRSTRHVSLTDLGERYLPRCIEILSDIHALKDEADEHSGTPRGPLRVTLSGIVARQVVSPIIPGFLADYPEVVLKLDTTNKVVDLMSERMDLAIRIGELEDSRLVARKICELRSILVASPEFLEAQGRPQSLDALTGYPCLVDTVPAFGARWPILNGKMVSGPAEVSDGEIIRDLAVAGLGVAYLPEIFVNADLETGRLEHILPREGETFSIYAVFPPRGYISTAARAFAAEIEKAYRDKARETVAARTL
ncbi:MAG: LysR family transcriptional regulator [Roseibium sp.]|uniref:LysR family transcriptional regulator n=1 Tax=Roseibium sp. TaxID=1936156 RepID=UPI001B1E607E|nr:LysR family transcriptional regulator [Roseibium sp.]MBO6893820.1 LysR family transcriptional regulator [Roseibium sp.]MBO6931134.1 LysR family transcriptional regulator [Roseibium sp.]